MDFTYGSVCSGVEAATVAWHPMGWKPSWFSQYDPEHNYKRSGLDFPSLVLAHHYPHIPNLGDMLKIEERPEYDERTINLLVGGTPCQSFSIAGLRKGLDDARGNLALKFCQILKRKQPRWFVWENVPGVLSSDEGRDFAAILSGFSECGYGFAYRILDAQYFGVAQRRRRVFVVGYLGNWRPAAAVLFEQNSLRGDSAPRRETGESVTGTLEASLGRSRGAGTPTGAILPVAGSHWDDNNNPHPSLTQASKTSGGIAASNQELFSQRGAGLVQTARMVSFGEYEMDGKASTLKARDHKDATDLICFQGKARATQSMNPSDIAPTLDVAKAGGTVIAHIDGGDLARTLTARHDSSATPDSGQNVVATAGFKAGQGSGGIGYELEKSVTLTHDGSHNAHAIHRGMAVRRLTPIECERLQGFPDDYTKIPINNRGGYAKDGPRYKAMGNSMAVPVMRWIGQRIQLFEETNGVGI